MEHIAHVSTEMITEIAMDVENPVAIAQRFGYSQQEYLMLCAHPWFTRAVEEKREILKSEGMSFKTQMGSLAQDMLIQAWQAASASDSVQNKLDVAKYLTKVAGLEPQPNALALAAGAGFSLVISLPPTATAAAQTIAMTGVQDLLGPVEDAFVIDTGPDAQVDALPPATEHYDFEHLQENNQAMRVLEGEVFG